VRLAERRGGADDVVHVPSNALVAELVEALGVPVVAYIGSADMKVVHSWRHGTATPQRLDALRGALQATRLLLATERPVVARAWFTGTNTHLGLEAPATFLRNALTASEICQVVRAARTFAA
jgi:hypothetical protein